MTEKESYAVAVAGLQRRLPLFEVAPGVRIAVFNMLGDTQVVKTAADALCRQLGADIADVIVTPEAKSIPLAYEMSAMLNLPYVVLRKSYKSYMGEAISTTTVSITTGAEQTLYLDEKDQPLLQGARILLVDDVISTGSTLKGMRAIVDQAGGSVAAVAAVFTEGDGDWSHVVALGNLPVFIS
jgi:adenine phosphoribosyltransferase